MLLDEVIHKAARERPDHPAIVFGDRKISYAELSTSIRQLSHALRRIANARDRVVIYADNCPEYIECLYGVPAADMVLVPINQRLAQREAAYIIENAEPAVIIVADHYIDRIHPILATGTAAPYVLVLGSDVDQFESYEHFSKVSAFDASQNDSCHKRSDEDVALLVYTSGTTERPKDAMITPRGLISSALGASLEWRQNSDDILLYTFPLCHITAFMVIAYHLRSATIILTTKF